MKGIEEFFAQAVATPSVQPDRPPEPEPLASFEQGPRVSGRSGKSVVFTDEPDKYPLTKAWLKTAPSNVADLRRWR